MTLEAKLGYTFRDRDLLTGALTHPSSLQRKQPTPAPYERLEFLGDRVLNLTIAAWLYELHPAATEGTLARLHAHLVRRDQLAQIAMGRLDLLPHLILAKNDETNERGQLTILGDAVEALFGALYLDSDYPTAERIIRALFGDVINAQGDARDPKTALQEWAQARGRGTPVYTLIERTGPSHAPEFTVEVTVQKEKPARGTGPSKQAAEKAAAEILLKQLDTQHDR